MLFMQTGFMYLISNYLVPKYGSMSFQFFDELLAWVIVIALIMMVCSLDCDRTER